VKISNLRALFHSTLTSLYEKKEIDAIFFIYIEYKYNIKKHDFFLNPNVVFELDEADIESLAKGMPIQYIIGKTTFYNIEIKVNPSVLIPRPETEEMVQHIIHHINSSKHRIIDLCTGSGAIAIALAKNMQNVEIWATDNSKDAIKTAKKNAALNNVEIHFLLHDILQDDISMLPDDVDIIVSNPPYIPLSERTCLHKNVVNYEPFSALFVPDENPLLFYHAIAHIAKKILHCGGVLYLETHENYHSELAAMLFENNFHEIELREDLNGKPRFVSCKKL
jgi:release factor glutamine methyltransferase